MPHPKPRRIKPTFKDFERATAQAALSAYLARGEAYATREEMAMILDDPMGFYESHQQVVELALGARYNRSEVVWLTAEEKAQRMEQLLRDGEHNGKRIDGALRQAHLYAQKMGG
jgi:hypothetical protein